ncbi:MAG: hypothetical protein KDB14_05020 [Planctomycetales bacterium]|nr:hypothetical protein [Planctomycetales bacterium]
MKNAELLVAEYNRIGHDIGTQLQAGISKSDARDLFRNFLTAGHPVNTPLFPSELPNELYEMFSWHNGGGELVPYYDFMSFDEALDSWDLTSEMAEDSVMYENGNAVFADTSPFPILNHNNSHFVVMDVGEHSPTRLSIGRMTANGFTSVRNEFEDLSQFLRAHLECVKAGAYFVGEYGLDFEERSDILSRFRSGKILTVNGAQLGL